MAINATPDVKVPPTIGAKPAGGPPRAVPPRGPAPVPKDKKSVRLASQSEIQRWLEKSYLTAGASIIIFKPALGEQIITSAPKCATAVAKLCMENDALRKAISAAMVTSVWGAVITAHLPIILVLAAEYRPTDDTVRFNQQTLMGFAAMLNGAEDEDDDDDA